MRRCNGLRCLGESNSGSCLLDVIVFQFDRDELMRGECWG